MNDNLTIQIGKLISAGKQIFTFRKTNIDRPKKKICVRGVIYPSLVPLVVSKSETESNPTAEGYTP